MTTSELIMIFAVVAGPVAAVAITLWHQGRRQKREQRLTLLRHVLAFRHMPGDANYTHAINMIPIEFADIPPVITAHREWIAAANQQTVREATEGRGNQLAIKQTRLIYEIAHSLGFKIRETDLQTEAYTATGFVERDNVFLDAHKAWRDIANLLYIQAVQAEGRDLTEEQQRFLGILPINNGEQGE